MELLWEDILKYGEKDEIEFLLEVTATTSLISSALRNKDQRMQIYRLLGLNDDEKNRLDTQYIDKKNIIGLYKDLEKTHPNELKKLENTPKEQLLKLITIQPKQELAPSPGGIIRTK